MGILGFWAKAPHTLVANHSNLATVEETKAKVKPYLVKDLLTERGRVSNWLEVKSGIKLLGLEKILRHDPTIQLVCVMNAYKEIEGLISPKQLYERLLRHVAPGQVLREVVSCNEFHNYFECVNDVTAVELMIVPAVIQPSDTLDKAYFNMRKGGVDILPVLDEAGQIVNCLLLEDLVSFWANHTPQLNSN